MDDSQETSFEIALARYLDGEPEPGDGELISQTLREDPARIREVSGLAAIEELLRLHSEPEEYAFVEGLVTRIESQQSGGEFVRRMKRRLEVSSTPQTFSRRLPWMLAAAACVAAAVGWWRVIAPTLSTPSVNIASVPTVTRPGEPLALMVNQSQARFSQGGAPDIVSFGRGDYTLQQGSAHLRFRNGTDMVIVAPTRFHIDDAFHVRLAQGTVRALVPPSGRGFEVSAPGVEFRDLGTEFGVKVADAGGKSELHVFDGQVEVFKAGAAEPQETVYGGQAVLVNAGAVTPDGAAREADFPSVNSISLSRWLAWRKEFRNDPNLVLYYPFVRNPKDPAHLKNDARHGPAIPGTIEGAQWVTGRWAGKAALQFENKGDDVLLDIPGQYDQLTLAAWIKVDRVENVEHTILSSVNWQPGGLQWQFNRRRSVSSTSVFSDPKRRVLWAKDRLPVGRWFFWAVTIDRANGRILHYLDGKLVCEAAFAPGSLLMPGRSAIGRWINDSDIPEVREFRGRIDELAVWRVALPPGRIEALSDAGMPVELPDTVVAQAQ